MISKLRSRHRLIWFPIIALVVVIVIITGPRLLTPLNDVLPGFSTNTEVLQLVDEATIAWENENVSAAISRNADNALILSITSNSYINKPDLLLYMNRIGGSNVTRESLLIGSFAQNNSQHFTLPDSSLTNGSVFILYSLPKNEVVDIATVTVGRGN